MFCLVGCKRIKKRYIFKYLIKIHDSNDLYKDY